MADSERGAVEASGVVESKSSSSVLPLNVEASGGVESESSSSVLPLKVQASGGVESKSSSSVLPLKVEASGGVERESSSSLFPLKVEAGGGVESKSSSSVQDPLKMENHPRELANQAFLVDDNFRITELDKLRQLLDVIVHVFQCITPRCQTSNCRAFKKLCHHLIKCDIRAQGGCIPCKKFWYFMRIHAQACKASECKVTRCREMKEILSHPKLAANEEDAKMQEMLQALEREKEIAFDWIFRARWSWGRRFLWGHSASPRLSSSALGASHWDSSSLVLKRVEEVSLSSLFGPNPLPPKIELTPPPPRWR